jgi:hypothetical protein
MNFEKEVIKFPIEVINIIQGLDHPDRRRILEVIINSGKGELTFEEIIKKTGYTSDTVNIHLTHMWSFYFFLSSLITFLLNPSDSSSIIIDNIIRNTN